MNSFQPFLFILFIAASGFDKPKTNLNDAERAKAVDYLKSTESALFAAVKGLSEEQLNFKPGNDSWSIRECVERIAISEQQIFDLVDVALKAGADPFCHVKPQMTYRV